MSPDPHPATPLSAAAEPRGRARRRRAFTLLELIVVVIILAVLAAIATLGYNKYVDEAKWTALHATTVQIDKAVTAKSARDDLTPPELVVDALAAPTSQVSTADPATAALEDYFSFEAYGAVTAVDENRPPKWVQVTRWNRSMCLFLGDEVAQRGRIVRGECASVTDPGPGGGLTDPANDSSSDSSPTPSPAPDGSTLPAPMNVSAVPDNSTGAVAVTWDAVTGAAEYVVCLDGPCDAGTEQITTNTSLALENVAAGEHTITVTARDASGADGTAGSATVTVPDNTAGWTQVAGGASEVSLGGRIETSAVVGTKIYVFDTKRFAIFDTVTRTWAMGSQLPLVEAQDWWTDFTTTAIGDQIYLVGGIYYDAYYGGVSHNSTGEMWALDTNTLEWASKAGVGSRYSHAAATDGVKLYITGGGLSPHTTDVLRDALEYDPATNTWTNLPQITYSDMWGDGAVLYYAKGKYEHSMVVQDNRIYMTGGRDYDADRVGVFDLATKKWIRNFASDSDTNGYADLVQIGAKTYRLNGAGGVEEPTDVVSVVTFTESTTGTHTWVDLPQRLPAVMHPGSSTAEAVGDSLYAIYLDKVVTFTP